MRILAVADFFPWPATKGGLLRVSRNIEILARLGEVDLFSLYDVSGPAPQVPDSIRLHRLAVTPYPAVSAGLRSKASWLTHRGVPASVALRMSDPTPRRAFDAFVEGPYDVVWWSTAGVWHWLGRPDLGPSVIDLIDLEDVKARQAADRLRRLPAPGVRALADRTVGEARLRLDAVDWGHLQQAAAQAADRVVVCSVDDATRLGAVNVEVVPNTYAAPARAVGRAAAGSPPTVLFPASFDYWPNAEGARWLVEEIAPAVRLVLPGTVIRLAGQSTPGTEASADPPDVVVTGLVADMTDELARADVVVVPLRSGSGTRLKILEAMAHGVPVVSTTIGAEGLDVQDGVHLLVADTAEAMVAAVERLQDDPGLRARLVANARARFDEGYEDRAAADRIHDVVDSLRRDPGRGR